jgi:aspartate beta-hydroxylase/beta-hydroxylase
MLSVLNRLYSHYAGGNQRPVYFDIDKTYPSLTNMTDHFSVIKHEFEQAVTQLDKLPQYHELDPRQADISNACEKKWSIFMLYLMGHQSEEAKRLCPRRAIC